MPGLDSAEVHTIYLRANAPVNVGVKLDNGPMLALNAEGNGRIEVRAQRTGRKNTLAGACCKRLGVLGRGRGEQDGRYRRQPVVARKQRGDAG